MGVEGFLSTEDERAARQLVEQADLILQATDDSVPGQFASRLFGRAVAEDVRLYTAHELASLALGAYGHLAARRPGAPDIRVELPRLPDGEGERLGKVTLIEIVNDDMPFLLDSVMAALNARGLTASFVVHPIFGVERDAAGALDGLTPADMPVGARARRESLIQIHIPRIEDEAQRAALAEEIGVVLGQVRRAVADWKPMMEQVQGALADLANAPAKVPAEEVEEAVALLEWLLDGNFTFLGSRNYDAREGAGGRLAFDRRMEDALGVLADEEFRLFRRASDPRAVSMDLSEVLAEETPLIVVKSRTVSYVHRRAWIDVVVVKRYDAEGRVVGGLCVAGLFTNTAYAESVRAIPLVRQKVAGVLVRAGFVPESHSGRALVKVLELFPRDDLFQIDPATLFQFSMAILQLDEHPRVRVLAWRERFERFVSVLVFVPRDRYGSEVRERIGRLLEASFGGQVAAFRPLFVEGPLTRVHFIVEQTGAPVREVGRIELEDAVAGIIRTWGDAFAAALGLVFPPAQATALARRYSEAFPVGYQSSYTPEEALADLRLIERLSAQHSVAADFARAPSVPGRERVALKVLSYEVPRLLSERVPMLEAMGFVVVDERTFTVRPEGTPPVYVHDMVLGRRGGGEIALDVLEGRLHSTLMAVLRGTAENDGFNALALNARLGWRDIALLRTLARYLRQIGVPFSQDYLWATLNAHPAIVDRLVALFHARFDVEQPEQREERQAAIREEIEAALAEVQSLDEDRILRRFANLIEAAVRTNFHQRGEDGGFRPTIAIKFLSHKVEGLPLPRPLFEIFVHSPRVEGIHLRFGRVARGGLRWSDRPQDFRTEVLGLVKAQQVKNAVIVPVGAKGGFVPAQLPTGPREAIQAEGVEAYKLFISSLLDVTDNIDGGAIVPPPQTVRHDEDDPYLVVAADKGTATFSDTANALSQARGFWLGDAFASGGSVGYDHKAMGITARGAWEAVRRHFREMDVDIRVTPFTVVGVGDMSGDVFGNGMMLENTIKLVAAFDHRDIFLDPNPDPLLSLAERQRLFALPRSSWQDYDKSLISAGGGVFPRTAKSIALSPAIREVLGFDKSSASPAEVISAILRAPVDLLWFGGIGTYVRALNETDAQVGDRANDAIRIAGAEVRAKAIGEGANLGVTQRGRIEAARRGVRLNTDAIDNSAGVNTSDVEVNIKIALGPAVREGQLDAERRAELLASMTDEVAELVLGNNYLQTLALSLAERRSLDEAGFLQRLMQRLEARDLLDRAVEFLPSDAELNERRGRGEALTRPELAVLLAYAKLTAHSDLLDTDVPDDPYLARELAAYFPPELRERFPEGIEQHRLRRDIIATRLSNAMINHGGPTFVARLADETGATVGAIAKAFAAVRDGFGLNGLNEEIDALDGVVPGSVQLDLYGVVQDMLLDRSVWFLRNVDLLSSLDELVAHYAAGIAPVETVLSGPVRELLPEETRGLHDARVAQWTQAGVPEGLARRIARLPAVENATDIVLIADRTKASISDVAVTFFAVGLLFRLDRIFGAARTLSVTDYYDRLALERALTAFEIAVRRLTAEVIEAHGPGVDGVTAWAAARGEVVERARTGVHEIAASGLSVSKLSVAASLIGDLVRG
ncbi:NAD-glutamate dehydrogenase [Ancylobacter novellus DSM 506]|uniref:NAD-glutamate dehydrogenase n=1 Tax=Ancylobacter novellus (strain ATCC 8093 / DSM 506 / JCM 20403 / CCM 1077 / IAM 12100 / NBRC 12443 / NCIMB 10456) TaxID=639283 RepID=D7A5Y6_ANCN5|nr:NAD-glutamate dehydrogenase [Ancylobacter novellus]ADH90101.1 NAD-glutamate dehydrogenase [Ancylobacter novellus DSM 506]